MRARLENVPILWLPFFKTDAADPFGPLQTIRFGHNRIFGFSPGVTILTRVPGVDLAMTGAAPITDIARSLDSTAPVVLVNSSTLVHHLMFVELDANATTEAKRAMIIHPSVNLDEGTTYIVALRDMKNSSGTILTPNADFLAYRDNIPTGDPVKEARRPHMESIFTTLASAGVPRNNLYLAWDFTVASRRSLTERMLFVRDDGFSRLGTNAPTFTVTNILEHPCTAGMPAFGACSTDADCVGGRAWPRPSSRSHRRRSCPPSTTASIRASSAAWSARTTWSATWTARRRPRSSCWTATASPRTSRRLSRRRSCATSRAPRCRPGPGPPSRRARRSMGTGSSAPTPR